MAHSRKVGSTGGMIANKYHEKPCAHCGILMVGNKAKQTYCSQACANKSNAKKITIKSVKCAYCDTVIIKPRAHQKYCSLTCRAKGRKKDNENRKR